MSGRINREWDSDFKDLPVRVSVKTGLGPDLSKLTVKRCFGSFRQLGTFDHELVIRSLKNSTSKETNRGAETTLGNDDNCSSRVLFRMLSNFLHVSQYSVSHS